MAVAHRDPVRLLTSRHECRMQVLTHPHVVGPVVACTGCGRMLDRDADRTPAWTSGEDRRAG